MGSWEIGKGKQDQSYTYIKFSGEQILVVTSYLLNDMFVYFYLLICLKQGLIVIQACLELVKDNLIFLSVPLCATTPRVT